jgi:hypothetical protein
MILLYIKKDDEDEGSLSRDRVNDLHFHLFQEPPRDASRRAGVRPENRQFSGSPPGVPSPVYLSLQRK